jgi:hypothetical protein
MMGGRSILGAVSDRGLEGPPIDEFSRTKLCHDRAMRSVSESGIAPTSNTVVRLAVNGDMWAHD